MAFEHIKDNLNLYQINLRDLLIKIPNEKLVHLIKNKSSHLATGKCIIWSCNDGYLVAFENSFSSDISYTEIESNIYSMVHIYNQNVEGFFTFYDLISKLVSKGHTASFDPNTNFENNLFTIIIEDSLDSHLQPIYSKVLFIGKNYLKHFWQPEEHATKDINNALELLNLRSKETAKELLDFFKNLLDTALKEEEVQVFLKEHPEFIFPEYESVIPKPNLGGEFIPDFAVSIRQNNGLQWIFVEIEKPSKKIFTQGETKFQFTSEFTQAKGQLLEWDSYISQNILFFKEKFPGLLKPKFHLVYGRNFEIDEKRRNLLMSEFNESNNRTFSTFDDLHRKFENIVQRIKR